MCKSNFAHGARGAHPASEGDLNRIYLPGSFGFANDMHCTNFGAVGALVMRQMVRFEL